MGQKENDSSDGGILYPKLIATKVKYCLSNIEYGKMEEKTTFESFSDPNMWLSRREYFDLLEGEILTRNFIMTWKKILMVVFVIPQNSENVKTVI